MQSFKIESLIRTPQTAIDYLPSAGVAAAAAAAFRISSNNTNNNNNSQSQFPTPNPLFGFPFNPQFLAHLNALNPQQQLPTASSHPFFFHNSSDVPLLAHSNNLLGKGRQETAFRLNSEEQQTQSQQLNSIVANTKMFATTTTTISPDRRSGLKRRHCKASTLFEKVDDERLHTGVASAPTPNNKQRIRSLEKRSRSDAEEDEEESEDDEEEEEEEEEENPALEEDNGKNISPNCSTNGEFLKN